MMSEHRCDVRCYRGRPNCPKCAGKLVGALPGTGDCEYCRTGCFEVAKFRNPVYDPDGHNGGRFNYAEWLCADHYDEVMEYEARKEQGALEPWEDYDRLSGYWNRDDQD